MANERDRFEVVCGNIGYVYQGDDADAARAIYGSYVTASKSGRGLAGHEPVALSEGGEIIDEHERELESE